MKMTCAICGKTAKYISPKFISPLCEDCAKEQAIKIANEYGINPEFVEFQDYYTEPCEEMNNIAKLCGTRLEK